MKKKPELELFSPTQEGVLVPLSKYLIQMLEFAKTEWQGINITESHIKKAWTKLQKNEYLDDDAPDEMLEMYEKMSADWEMAQEMEEERLSGINEDPKNIDKLIDITEEEIVEEKPKNESLALVESVKDGLELSSFTQKFDIGAGMTQCVPRGDVDMKDWVAAFAFGLTLESGAQWIIGDSVVALEAAGHDDVVNQLCSNFKKSYPTVSGYARACRAFPSDKRDPMLPFTVYREIGNANFGDEKTNAKKQSELLEAAKTEKLSSTEVRNRVRSEQGKDDKPTNHRFLLLNVGNFSNSEVFRTMPNEVQEHQLLIDLSDKSWFDPAEENWMKFLKEQ
jgi:hypothetical protein